MGDLATALVDLAQSAQGRRTARKKLREAVEVVVGAIVAQGRAGDSATVGGRCYRIVSRRWLGSQWADGSRSRLCPKAANVLVVDDDAALADVRESWFDGHNMHHPIGSRYATRDGDDAERMATDAEREAFASDAVELVAAFARQCRSEAESMGEAAEALVRLAPR